MILSIILVASPLFADTGLVAIPKQLRDYYVRKAKVWRQKDVRSADILAGPQNKIAVAPETEVSCHYMEGSESGFAPKFTCKLAGSNEVVMVKYKSRETFAELASSRLLWALGFYADENYPVKLKCLDCPEKNPSKPAEGERRVEKIFEDAIIERHFTGEIGEHPDQGWEWEELDELPDDASGQVQRDALKLLAVFIQHTDSKREQQRLGCYPEDIQRKSDSVVCENPVLMIQDLGATFGKGAEAVTSESQMTFRLWKEQSIWNAKKEEALKAENSGRQVCFGNLVSAKFMLRDGLSDPQISEAGRSFLAKLLNQLSDQQIHDLFQVARADKTGEQIETGGEKRPVTIEDWVQAFKEKRKQINDRRCSS